MTAQGDRTKAKLIAATTRLVGQVGYHQATTRAIAKLAGVAEGTLYRHFPDKRSLFFAAVLADHQPVLNWMARLPALAGTAPLADILTQCLTQLWQLRRTVLPSELALASDTGVSGTGPSQLDLTAMAATGGPPQLLAVYLRAEQELGRIRAELDAGQIAVVLLATLFGLALAPSPTPAAAVPGPPDADPDPDPDPDPEMLAAAVSLLLNGIATISPHH